MPCGWKRDPATLLGVNEHGQSREALANDRVVEKNSGRECQVVDDPSQFPRNGLFRRDENGKRLTVDVLL